MKSHKKTVVMACTHPYWSALQVGSQHLARQFVEHGWTVYYISAPISPIHLPVFLRSEVPQRFRATLNGPIFHQNGALRSHIPFSLMAPAPLPVLSCKWVMDNWHKTLIPRLQRWIHKIIPDVVDLLYIDNLSYHFLLDHVPHEQSVFRVMDRHVGFSGWGSTAGDLARKIAMNVDMTVYSALSLHDYVLELGAGQNHAFIPNGVNFKFFCQTTPIHQTRPSVLRSIPGPIILYSGMIDSRIDMTLIRKAAERLPKVSFVLAGPVEAFVNTGAMPGNVYFIGPFHHTALPSLMSSAAAGMIPFDIGRKMNLISGMRPLKLFEYMAAGLPVISAKWAELETLDAPVWFYHDLESFIGSIQKAVNSPHDPKPYQEYARRNAWSASFNKLLRVLNLTSVV